MGMFLNSRIASPEIAGKLENYRSLTILTAQNSICLWNIIWLHPSVSANISDFPMRKLTAFMLYMSGLLILICGRGSCCRYTRICGDFYAAEDKG